MKKTRFWRPFTLIPSVNRMPPMRYMRYDDTLQIQRWWNWYTIDRAGRFCKVCWRICTYLPIFLSPPSLLPKATFERWMMVGGGGVPCGAQGTVKVLPGALPQRSPNAFIVWACPQLQIHDHLSLRSKSSHVPHVKESKQNSQGLLILAELLLRREKFC